jgi:hypothetical protein
MSNFFFPSISDPSRRSRSGSSQGHKEGALDNRQISLLANTRYPSPLEPIIDALLSHFGPQLLHSLLLSAGSEGPRSVIPNLAELLASLVVRIPGADMAAWLQTILAPPDFPDPRATGESKLRLKETILRSRTARKMREALNEFALVSRGLANTTYGNATAM